MKGLDIFEIYKKHMLNHLVILYSNVMVNILNQFIVGALRYLLIPVYLYIKSKYGKYLCPFLCVSFKAAVLQMLQK